MSDDRFYCRSGSKFFALCLLLISSVFFFLECLGWRFSRLLFLIFLCHLYRKGVLLGAFDHRFPSVPKVVLWCDHRKEFAKML